MIKKFAVVLAVIAAGLAMAAGPASAAGTWQPVKTTPDWNCNTYRQHVGGAGIKYKACTVVNSSNGTQVVLVAQNPTSSNSHWINGTVTDTFGAWSCGRAIIGPGKTMGCYGKTNTLDKCDFNVGEVKLFVDNVSDSRGAPRNDASC